jgi:solute carrier family 35 protein F5
MGLYKWHLGLVLLLVVIVCWVSSGFLVNAASDEYAKPYFITYVNTSLFTLYLAPTALRVARSRVDDRSKYTRLGDSEQFSTRETAVLGAQFAALWFLSNCFNNASYMYTTVGSSTIMACTSSFFTLILGIIFKTEKFSLPRLGAILVSFFGVVLVSRADEKDESAPPNALLGNCLSLVSAFLYASYSTLLKSKVKDESRLNSKQFFGFVGLFNTLFLWPVILGAHCFGVEPFGWPTTSRVWILLSLNAFITLVSDFFWVLATLFTSPLVVTVGLSGTIPLSMIGDFFLKGRLGSVIYYVGAAMVLWSFFVVNKHSKQEQDDNNDDLNEPLHA